MHYESNRKQREHNELVFNLPEFPVLLVHLVNTVTVTVDHHQECLVEADQCLILVKEVRLIIGLLQVHEPSVLE